MMISFKELIRMAVDLEVSHGKLISGWGDGQGNKTSVYLTPKGRVELKYYNGVLRGLDWKAPEINFALIRDMGFGGFVSYVPLFQNYYPGNDPNYRHVRDTKYNSWPKVKVSFPLNFHTYLSDGDEGADIHVTETDRKTEARKHYKTHVTWTYWSCEDGGSVDKVNYEEELHEAVKKAIEEYLDDKLSW